MANDIKQKIVLEGEKEYNRALSEAKRNLKTLRSELKAETAELGANATAQQKNETRIKSLQKQIKEQEKIVKTYQDALKEVKEKYADNEDAIAKWEVKLNDARTSLANMKNELEGVGKGFDSIQGSADMATVASKSVADAFGQLGSIGETISGAVENIFNGLIDTLRDTLTEIWGMIADTAAKANNWTDLASYYGTTASEIEKINKAVEWSQGNFQDFTNLLNQLAWGGKGKKITEWFEISDANYDDKLAYAMDVLQQMNKMQKEDPKKLGDAMEDIFGAKKSQQIMWFVSNLEQVQTNLQQITDKGYDLGDDNIKTMNDVWLKLGEIEGKWESLKEKFAAGFGQVTLEIMTNVNGTLDALAKYFNADTPQEREQALKELEDNIVETFKSVVKAIQDGVALLDQLADDLKGSEDPTAQALGNILGGLVDALQWLTEDNMQNVVSALEILAAFWITGKGLTMAAKIAEVAGNIAVIKGFNFTGSAGAALEKVAAGLTASEVTSAVSAAAGPIAAAIANLTMSVGVVTLAVPVVAALADVIKGQWPDWLPKSEIPEGLKEVLSNPAPSSAKNDKKSFQQLIKDMFGIGSDDAEGYIGGNIPTTGVTIPTRRTPHGNEYYIAANAAQQAAANAWWDVYKNNPVEAGLNMYSELEAAFEGNEEVLSQLLALVELMQQNQKDNEFNSLEDLPSEWWGKQGGNSGETDGLTSADAKSMTDAVSRMPKAVAASVSGIRVIMDGATVGRLVAPYVSQNIATAIV